MCVKAHEEQGQIMEHSNDRKSASDRQPPWSQNRIGKFSLEEIALEFILWEDDAAHSDTLRRDFIHEALQKNVGDKQIHETVEHFLRAYERLYEKIYQRKQGNTVKPDRATPENVRQLLTSNVQRKAA